MSRGPLPTTVFVHDDLDVAWREVALALLAGAVSSEAWNKDTGRADAAASLSAAGAVGETRAERATGRVVRVDVVPAFASIRTEVG